MDVWNLYCSLFEDAVILLLIWYYPIKWVSVPSERRRQLLDYLIWSNQFSAVRRKAEHFQQGVSRRFFIFSFPWSSDWNQLQVWKASLNVIRGIWSQSFLGPSQLSGLWTANVNARDQQSLILFFLLAFIQGIFWKWKSHHMYKAHNTNCIHPPGLFVCPQISKRKTRRGRKKSRIQKNNCSITVSYGSR